MDRQQILDLYEWQQGTCFRHPAEGEVETTVVGLLHPRAASNHEVRACADCVISLEDIRREQAGRTGGTYQPGPVVTEAGQKARLGHRKRRSRRGESGELRDWGSPWGE